MKKLMCKDLGGPCEQEFTGESFEEIGQKCKAHVIEKMNSDDKAHTAAAGKMRDASPEEQKAMVAEYEKRFNEAPEV